MKKILLSLLIGFVGIISFCNAGSFTYNGTLGDNSFLLIPQKSLGKDFTLSCDFVPSTEDCNGQWQMKWNLSYYYGTNPPYLGNTSTSSWIFFDCGTTTTFTYDFNTFSPPASSPNFFGVSSFNITNLWIPDGLSINYTCTFVGDNVISAGGSCPSCPEVNTGEILSGYILESSIDENYCVSNDLCPFNSGDSASWSELVINDIVHQSAPLININIPQEFDWSYTVDENEFDLGISGYNVDTDYIDGIITTQNAKPSTEDFNKIITGLIPLFVPGLVIILFLRFVFKFIKKIF